MIYYYDIDLSFTKGKSTIICYYTVSFVSIIDFLYNMKIKHSSITILAIRPHINRHNNKFYKKID